MESAETIKPFLVLSTDLENRESRFSYSHRLDYDEQCFHLTTRKTCPNKRDHLSHPIFVLLYS